WIVPEGLPRLLHVLRPEDHVRRDTVPKAVSRDLFRLDEGVVEVQRHPRIFLVHIPPNGIDVVGRDIAVVREESYAFLYNVLEERLHLFSIAAISRRANSGTIQLVVDEHRGEVLARWDAFDGDAGRGCEK